MSFLDAQRLGHAQRVRRREIGEHINTPDLGTVVSLSYDEAMEGEMIGSAGRTRQMYQGSQMAELRELYEDGTISEDEWSSHRKRNIRNRVKTDWDGLATLANERLNTDKFDFSDEKYYSQVRAASEERQNVLAKANPVAGLVGGFTGTMGAYLNPQNPVNFAMLVLPGAQLKVGSTVWRTAANMAWREAAVGVGEEVVNQMNIYDFKNTVGMEYTISDAAMNLLVAGVFSGAMGGVTGPMRHMWNATQVDKLIEANDVTIRKLDNDRRRLDPVFQPVRLRPAEAPAAKQLDIPSAFDTVAARADIEATYLPRAKAALRDIADSKMSREEVKLAEQQLKEIKQEINAVDASPMPVERRKDLPARQAKREAVMAGKKLGAEQRAQLEGEIADIEKLLADNAGAAKAEADLSRLTQGITPDNIQAAIDAQVTARERSWAEDVAARNKADTHEGLPEGNVPMGKKSGLPTYVEKTLEDLKAQQEFLKTLPRGTSALDAQRAVREKFDTPVDEDPKTSLNAAAEVDAAQTVVKADSEVQFNQIMDDDTPMVMLDDEGNLLERGTLGEAMDTEAADLDAKLTALDKVAECMRG